MSNFIVKGCQIIFHIYYELRTAHKFSSCTTIEFISCQVNCRFINAFISIQVYLRYFNYRHYIHKSSFDIPIHRVYIKSSICYPVICQSQSSLSSSLSLQAQFSWYIYSLNYIEKVYRYLLPNKVCRHFHRHKFVSNFWRLKFCRYFRWSDLYWAKLHVYIEFGSTQVQLP